MATDVRQEAPGRAPSVIMARALAGLIDTLTVQGAAGANAGASPTERRDAVREALRALAGSARSGALHCFVDEAGMHVNEHVILPADLRTEPSLYGLARRMVSHAVGTLIIRQGAAPGELLTLGRLLADAPAATPPASDDAAAPRSTPTEVLRSWSVLVTPASTPLVAPGAVSHTVAGAVAKLRAARTDDATRQAVNAMLDLATDAETKGDAEAIESIAVMLANHARALGSGEGRLATEGGLRRLLREGVVALLASRIPQSADRDTLVAILARTGEMGGRALVAQLMASEDRPARRSFFDAIVTQDSGVAQLREALNDSRWFVVRNAAALLGEMGMTEADASLIPLLVHLDVRIRIAAARALTRLRTARGLGALQQRLDDENAEVRRLAAAAFGLASDIAGAPKPQSAPLAAALATEFEEDVALEMLAALGKLATTDAVQRLIRLALGSSEQAPQPGWFRVAALEALVAARGLAAVPTLEVLTADADDEVALSARRLLGSVMTS